MILGNKDRRTLYRIMLFIGDLETLIEGHDQINEEKTKKVKEILFNIGLNSIELIKDVYIDPRMGVNKLLKLLKMEDIENIED